MEHRNPWKTLDQRRVYRNQWLSLREDRVVRPDGQEGIYCVVELRPSVGVVALDGCGNIQLVGQWRYCLERFSWEIPTGTCEEGEDLPCAAKRELEEETGTRARSWQELGTIDNCNAVTTELVRLYLARDLELGEGHPGADEKIVSRWISFEEALKMALEGAITDSTSVVGILKTNEFLRNQLPTRPPIEGL